MQPKLILFSGLPGTGKSTLSYELSRRTGWSILSKDLVDNSYKNSTDPNTPWYSYQLLVDYANLNLKNGASVILDAVFTYQRLREQAFHVAQKYNAKVCPIVCVCSNEDVWKERLRIRPEMVEGWPPADWNEVMEVQRKFDAWKEPHLLLDSIHAFETNFAQLVQYLQQ